MVYCSSAGGVAIAECAEDNNNGKCLVTLETGTDEEGKEVSYNLANCYPPCDTEGKAETECGYDDENVNEDTLDTYTCTKTSKGNLWFLTEWHYCGTVCTNNACEVNKPCGSIDEMGSCQSNNMTFCGLDAEGKNNVLHVVPCGEYTCTEDEEWGADCE